MQSVGAVLDQVVAGKHWVTPRGGKPVLVEDPTPDEYLAVALGDAGVPFRFDTARLDTFVARPETATALAAARALGDADDRGLLLTGTAGTGKTHLAVGILAARALSRADVDPTFTRFRSRFAVVPQLLDDLRERVSNNKRPDPLPDLCQAPLLVLDDLGAEKVTDYVLERLFVLVNRRYNDVSPTVVTSNFSLDELAERGYGRLVSRLLEDSEHVHVEAPDYRVRQR